MWATLFKMFSCFFTMTVNHGNYGFIKKNDICWEESIAHRKKSIWTFVFVQYIYFCTNVLHVKWNLACPITVHFIFLMFHKYTKIQNNIHEKIIVGGHPVALVGQAKDFHQHHIWCFHCHAPGKICLNAAHISCNDQWCPHMQHSWHPTETSDLVLYDHILSTSILK